MWRPLTSRPLSIQHFPNYSVSGQCPNVNFWE